jgi:RNA polymerase sigma factor for flagellar operon FliA
MAPAAIAAVETLGKEPADNRTALGLFGKARLKGRLLMIRWNTESIDDLQNHFSSPQTPEDERRARLIVDHLSLVDRVVHRTAGSCDAEKREEYVAAGRLGLVEAAHRFDPDRGVKFTTFAYRRIRGAILDERRRDCFLPYAVRSQLRRYHAQRESLASELGHLPSDEQVAERMDRSCRKLRGFLNAYSGRTVHSSDVSEDDSDFVDSHKSPDEIAEHHDAVEQVFDRIRHFPRRLRLIIRLYFGRGLHMRRIGRYLGISESRVCQLCAQATKRLQVEFAR